jgi:PBP1b-binding outer membrane lipoprotein LpoB
MRKIWGAAALLAAVTLAGCSSNDSPAAAPSQPPATTAAATPTPDRVTLENSCRAALRAEYEAGFAEQGNQLPPSAQKPVCTVLDRPTIKRLANEAVDEIMGR